LRLPVDWLFTWLPEADSVVGRRIAHDSKWGRVLSPIVNQFTPDFAAAPPLPAAVLVDQLGVTLTLIAGEVERVLVPGLLTKIRQCIRERCIDPQLTASEIARVLNLSPRTVHRVLAGSRMTFASDLLDARISAVQGILSSPSASHLSANEIARQAGFLHPSHLARVMRKRTGHALPKLQN